MNKTQISQMPDEELIEWLRYAFRRYTSGDSLAVRDLADRLEIRNGDLESKRAHEQTMAEFREKAVEQAAKWRELHAKVEGVVKAYYDGSFQCSGPGSDSFVRKLEALRDE